MDERIKTEDHNHRQQLIELVMDDNDIDSMFYKDLNESDLEDLTPE